MKREGVFSLNRLLLKVQWWVVVILCGVSLLGGNAGCSRDRTETVKPAKKAPQTVISLDYGRVFAGKVVAGEEVTLAPKIPGKVAAVAVDVGDTVRAGQVVLRLDAAEIEAAVRQAAAAVKVAEAGLNQAALGAERAQAMLSQAQENYRLALANYERGKALLAEEAISSADFENRFEQPYVNAVGALKTAEAAYRQAVDQKERVAPAQVEQARAALAAAKTNLANTQVVAPLNGIVAVRNVDPGELASPQVPALTLVNIDTVYVEVDVPERVVSRLRVGQKVKVWVEAVRATPFTSEITRISPAADPRTKSFNVKVALKNPDHLLKPGMFATVNFSLQEKSASKA
ncbi:efflux RND transporter periplasmic adaptor subunit [Thermodesulfitimonas sp.]